jgi:hypothetical protein
VLVAQPGDQVGHRPGVASGGVRVQPLLNRSQQRVRQGGRATGARLVGQDGEAIGAEAADDAPDGLLVAPEVGGDLGNSVAQMGQAEHLQPLPLGGSEGSAARASVEGIQLRWGQADTDDLRHGKPSYPPLYEMVT